MLEMRQRNPGHERLADTQLRGFRYRLSVPRCDGPITCRNSRSEPRRIVHRDRVLLKYRILLTIATWNYLLIQNCLT